MWQALHDEFQNHDVDIISIALDTPTAAAPWLEPLRSDGNLALIDEALLTVSAFGWVNVPSTVWFDETGTIVRGPEISFVKPKQPMATNDTISAEQREMFDYINAFPHSGEAWLDALRDWVTRDGASRFALPPQEVVSRSRTYGIDHARAAAHYAMGEHLRALDAAAALRHFRRSHELDPEQWNRKRQAWALHGGSEPFATDFLTEMRTYGPTSFYPEVNLD